MARKKTFADDAQSFAEDVQGFVADARERFGKLVERHSDAHVGATPEGDEGGVWTAFIRAVGVFDDVERALSTVDAVARSIGDEAQAAINSRGSDDVELDPAEPSTHEPDELPKGVKTAKKATGKRAPAKKATAKKTTTKKVTGD